MELLTMSRSDAADLYITRAMRLANESAVLEEEAKTTKKLTDEDVITLLGYEVVSPHIAEVLSVAGRDVDQLIGNEEDPHKKMDLLKAALKEILMVNLHKFADVDGFLQKLRDLTSTTALQRFNAARQFLYDRLVDQTIKQQDRFVAMAPNLEGWLATIQKASLGKTRNSYIVENPQLDDGLSRPGKWALKILDLADAKERSVTAPLRELTLWCARDTLERTQVMARPEMIYFSEPNKELKTAAIFYKYVEGITVEEFLRKARALPPNKQVEGSWAVKHLIVTIMRCLTWTKTNPREYDTCYALRQALETLKAAFPKEVVPDLVPAVEFCVDRCLPSEKALQYLSQEWFFKTVLTQVQPVGQQ